MLLFLFLGIFLQNLGCQKENENAEKSMFIYQKSSHGVKPGEGGRRVSVKLRVG